MNISEYIVNEHLVIFDKLFLKGDRIYIESYDPVNGGSQRVFLTDRTFIGSISSDFFWKLEKKLSNHN